MHRSSAAIVSTTKLSHGHFYHLVAVLNFTFALGPSWFEFLSGRNTSKEFERNEFKKLRWQTPKKHGPLTIGFKEMSSNEKKLRWQTPWSVAHVCAGSPKAYEIPIERWLDLIELIESPATLG